MRENFDRLEIFLKRRQIFEHNNKGTNPSFIMSRQQSIYYIALLICIFVLSNILFLNQITKMRSQKTSSNNKVFQNVTLLILSYCFPYIPITIIFQNDYARLYVYTHLSTFNFLPCTLFCFLFFILCCCFVSLSMSEYFNEEDFKANCEKHQFLVT